MLPNESKARSFPKSHHEQFPNHGRSPKAAPPPPFPQCSPLTSIIPPNFKPRSAPKCKFPNEKEETIEVTVGSKTNEVPSSPAAKVEADTATPFHNNIYYKVGEISRYLRKKFPNMEQAILNFFEEPNFYGLHSYLKFATATDCKLQQRFIVIHKDVYHDAIAPELADLLKVNEFQVALPPKEITSVYRDVITVRFPTEAVYNRITDTLTKLNKKSYKSNGPSKSESKAKPRYQTQTHAHLLRVYKETVFICFDLEWHERDNGKILEFGWCVWAGEDMPILCHHPPGDPCMQQKHAPLYVDPNILTRHYIVKEYFGIRNHAFVEDMKFDYLYGKSMVASIQEIKHIFEKEWHALTKRYPVAFVGHGVVQDIAQLKFLDIHIPPDALIYDTSSMYKAVFGKPNEVNLRDLVRHFRHDPMFMHNAGNDSYYTMICFREFIKYVPRNQLIPHSSENEYMLYKPVRTPIQTLEVGTNFDAESKK